MKSLRIFLEDFVKSQGFWVFVAFFLVKISSFITNILLIRILPKEEFGILAVVPAVFTLFAPFIGYGFPSALLRYGSLLKSDEEKDEFSAQLFRKGFAFQLFLSVLFFLVSIFFLKKYVGILPIFGAFAIRLLGLFLFTHIQSELRISKGNRSFSVFTILNTAFTFVITIIFTWIFGLKGYLFAVAICPFFCVFWLKNFKPKKNKIFFKPSEIRKFSEHSAFTNILAELLFSADILLLSYLMNENAVADYRTAILIPSNVVFLAQSFLQAGYPQVASKSTTLEFLQNFTKQFYKLFIPVVAIIILVGFLARNFIIDIFFGREYTQVSEMFVILLIAFSCSMLLRIFAGNMLAATGNISANTLSTIVSLFILVASAFIFVPNFGSEGMAYSMCIALFSGGIFGMMQFLLILRKKR